MRAERTVIGMRRVSCVANFEGRSAVEHKAMMKTCDKKKREKRIGRST